MQILIHENTRKTHENKARNQKDIASEGRLAERHFRRGFSTRDTNASIRNIITALLLILSTIFSLQIAEAQNPKDKRMVGLYIHQHWGYNRPYAARTWTLDDWRGWADGLKKIGYNTVMVWAMLETIPEPMTPSDRAYLTKLGKVIEMLHRDFGMRAYIVICPNIRANNAEAAKATFEKRHYYYSDTHINPGDPAALDSLVKWREQMLQYVKEVDGIAIIDSDPGHYPGSTNAEFVNLLAEHRTMLNRVRPNIELVYWMHAGWRGWSRFYETGKLKLGTPEELLDTLTQLKAVNPEPWGVANGLQYAEKLGIADKVISFNYGYIEAEPSFPMTNFGSPTVYEGGKAPTARGVMGNAQTHCVQLPNIFAFARGATGQPLTEADFLQFAEDLIPNNGALIVSGWKTLAGTDPKEMERLAAELEAAARENPIGGRLKGLLFGNPKRFLGDLVKMLRLRAAVNEFASAVDANQNVKPAFRKLVTSAEKWQKQHGYENNWYDPKLHTALRKLNSASINAVLNITYEANEPFAAGITTPSDQVKANFRTIETYTPVLLSAMKQTLRAMK